MASGKAGSLLIDIAANTAQLKKDMGEAKESIAGFGQTVQGVAGAVKGYYAAMVAREVIESIKELVTAVGDLADEAKRVGLSTQDFQALTIAMQSAGVKATEVQTALAAGSRFLGQAMEGNKQSIDTLNKLKVTILDASGAARPYTDDLQRLAKAVLDTKDPFTQAALAQQIFGKSAKEILPALEQLAAGIDDARDKAGRAIIPDDVIKRFNDFETVVKSTARTLVADLAVSLDSLAGAGDGTASKALQGLINLILDIGQNLRILAASDAGQTFAVAWAASLVPFKLLLISVDLLIKGLTALPQLVDDIVTKFRAASLAAQDFAKNLPSSDPGLSATMPGTPDPAKQAAALKAAQEAAVQSAKETAARIAQVNKEAADREAERQRRTLNAVLPQPNEPPPVTTAQILGRTGGSNPPPKATGTAKPDYFANTLKGIQDQTKAVTDATNDLAASSGLATKEAERLAQLQIDIAKNTAEAVKAAHATTPQQKADIAAAVADLDNAKYKLADFKQVLATADQVQSTFGDGSKALADRLEYLQKALDANKISQDEYNKAVRGATDAQALQAEQSKGLAGGFDGIVAGWNKAALAAGGAGAEMKIGEQAFTQTFSLMSNAISEFVTTGQTDFGKLAASFATMLANMALQWAAAGFLRNLGFGAAGGGVPYGPPAPAAAGVMSAGFRAAGGPVVPGRAYTVGENGPERFIPAMPGTIMAANNNGGNPNVAVNVDMTGNPNAGPDPRQTVEFARRVRAAVVDTISNEKRPGGILYTRQSA